MQIAGIIAEYNPLHCGHTRLMERIREQCGPETAILCVMSGNFVQRGDFAILGKHRRAEAAVKSGADLVLELPLPWAVSSAERFADGGVQTLIETGLTTHLAFGSECGEVAALQRLAAGLTGEVFPALLRRELTRGVSFAAARQAAMSRLLQAEDAKLLETPNNILGVEYCKSLLRRGSSIQPLALLREGASHDSASPEENYPSASALRALLENGRQEEALKKMPPAMASACEGEILAGRAPVFSGLCERAMLARLRSMTEADFAALDEGNEGLCHRLYAVSRTATTLADLLDAAKTKRYAYARLRRMVLWAYLGLTPADVPARPPYLRVLAANETGRALLSRMKKTAALPLLTKPADVRRLSPEARRLFEL
ncbi:MAG: nucleotidyltransferase family protein, partial [Oscillibacter sp.]